MRQLRNRHFLVSDVLLLTLAAYLSFVLRLEKLELGAHQSGFFLFTGVVLVVAPLVFRRAGVYSRYWRYASVEEMLLLVGAVTAAAVLTGAISLVAVQFLPSPQGHPPLPRSIPMIFLGKIRSSCCWRSLRPRDRVSSCAYWRVRAPARPPTARVTTIPRNLS